MVKLGIIRHARTQWNLEKKIQGSRDIGLCDEGIADAGIWGDILSQEGCDVILSSPMVRAEQTSQILSDKMGVKIEYDADLREQDFGDWEGKKLVDIRNQAPGMIEFQESKGWNFCPPGGESRAMVLKRLSRAIKNAAEQFDKKYVLVVTHNSVMKTLIYHAAGRTFTPGESPLLKDYYLHILVGKYKMRIEKLNYIKLLQADREI